jgi:pilus assembly protein CpaC
VARRLTVGLDKSMLVELPVDMKDVLVSNPEVLDAVVQSPRQVYLVGRAPATPTRSSSAPTGRSSCCSRSR